MIKAQKIVFFCVVMGLFTLITGIPSTHAQTAQTRQFPSTPAPYVHPRVFATAAELPQIKQNLISAGYGAAISPWLKNSVQGQVNINGYLRQLADGNFTINTVTESDINNLYFKFNEGSCFNLAVTALWGILFVQGDDNYVEDAKETAIRATTNHAILTEHIYNRYVNNDYAGLNSSTESAIKSHWSVQTNYSFTLSHTWRKGGVGTALAYDLLYNDMTTAQQEQSRKGIALSTSGWNMHGGDDNSPIGKDGNAVSNHYGYQGDEMVMLAAIYGETGFSQDAWDQGVKVMQNYLRVGFNSSGYAIEDSYGPDLGLREGARGLIAMARQGINEFEARPADMYNIGVAIAHDIEAVPNGSLIGGESGGNYAFGSNSTSGENANALYPSSAIIWKHVYPNDSTIDYWYRWRVGDNYNRKIRWQSMVDYAFFGQNYLPDYNPTVDLMAFYPQRGKLIARNNLTDEAIQFVFDARPDAFNIGHDKSGRGHFSLNGLGRRWVSHLNFRHVRYSTESSTMHIDGVGQAYKAPSVKIVSPATDDDLVVSMTADLKYAYDWQWSEPWTWSSMDNPKPYGTDWEHENIDPRTFYTAAPAPDWVGNTLWNDPNAGYKGLWMWRRPNLPVEKAYRSIAYVRSDEPFVILADDIKQDNTVRNYQSYIQLPFDLDQMSVNGNDAILWAKGDDRRLLVRVLQANTANNSTISFQNEAYTTSISPMDARRLIIGLDAVDPQLKIMLWPYKNGDALLQTNWNSDMTELSVNDVQLYVDQSNGYAQFSSCFSLSGDTDSDGICDSKDVCPAMDDNLIGTECNDGDPCTLNDRITENCQCRGSEEIEVLVTEDAKVRAGLHADSNFGTQNYLRTKYSGPASDLTREAFLKFDFKVVNDNSFNKVYLSLYVMQNVGGNSEQVLYFVTDDSWTESNINWNNKPTQTQVISTLSNVVPNERIYLDVTNAVNQEFNNDKIISFKIAEQIVGGHIIYRSKENSDDLKPKLIFTYNYLDDDNDAVCNALDNTIGSCALHASCDDGDTCTINDMYDVNCNCNGTLMFVDADNNNICDVDQPCLLFMNLGNSVEQAGIYNADNFIYSTSKINASSNGPVHYQAGDEYILLDEGFEVDGTVDFIAEIEDCDLEN